MNDVTTSIATYNDRINIVQQLGQHVLQSNTCGRNMLEIVYHTYCA